MNRRLCSVKADVLLDEEVGSLVSVNDKLWLFVKRDPWRAYLVRVYWWDLAAQVVMGWFEKRKEETQGE